MLRFLSVEADELAPQRLRQKALDAADAVIATFDGIAARDPRAIHEARRRLKELRALTALVGGRKEERRLFRNAGRLLSSERDLKAAIEAFDRLRERFAAEWTPRQFQKIRRALKARMDRTAIGADVDSMRAALTIERGHIAAWDVDEMHRDDLWPALARSYRRARRAMRRALDHRSNAAIHEWRKRVKTHWHNARFLSDVAVLPADPQIDALRDLSRSLGHFNDLVLVDEICRRSPDVIGSPRYVMQFQLFVARALSELIEEAQRSASSLFHAPTRVWIRAIRDRVAAGYMRIGPKKSPPRLTRIRATRANLG